MKSKPLGSSFLPLAIIACAILMAEVPAARERETTIEFREPSSIESDLASSTAASTAALDRVYLYGGPGTFEGRFENAFGVPDRQGWIGVDRSEQPSATWRVSTFNAENLGGHGAGNRALWLGRSAEEEPGWQGGTGYGNDWWNTAITWSSGPLDDPSVGRTVTLDFVFNYDTEPDYDFVSVRFRRNGLWRYVWRVSGTNAVGGSFPAPGARASQQSVQFPIEYLGGDYAGPGGDEIVLEIRFDSDETYSDEDGLFDSVAGAVQVDDITVTTTNAGAPLVSFEDFEGSGTFAWSFEQRIVGDFSKVMSGLTDPDPCWENTTPQMIFIDDGTPPNNVPGVSTGGSTFPERVDYGVPGAYTLNATGGVAGEDLPLRNEVWSPVIALDAPGPEDDGPGWETYIQYSVFDDYVLMLNGHHIMRTSIDGSVWSDWKDRPFVYFVPAPKRYGLANTSIQWAISEDANLLQVGFRVQDFSETMNFAWPPIGMDKAFAGPWFDDVAVYKVRTGPVIVAGSLSEGLVDAFPLVDAWDVSTRAARDLLDVDPVPAFGGTIAPSATISSILAHQGATLTDTRVEWILEKNPLFEDAIRTMPPGTTILPGTSPLGGDRWTGSFPVTITSTWGRGEFDVPRQDFLYPGDVLRYHYVAEADDGLVTTEPRDLTGFDDGLAWPELFTVRALPSVRDSSGTIPPLLAISADRDLDERLFRALLQNGLRPGIDFDHLMSFTGGRPLGSARASLEQIAPYTRLVAYLRGSPTYFRDDRPLLDAWYVLPGDRFAAWIGPEVAGVWAGVSQTRIGVTSSRSLWDDDLAGVRVLRLVPQADGLTQMLGVDRGCTKTSVTTLDLAPGALAGHLYELAAGGDQVPGAASVVFDRVVPEGRRVDVTVPFGLSQPRFLVDVPGDGRSASAHLIGEILDLLGAPAGGVTATPPSGHTGFTRMSVAPNPFNPSTQLRFTLGHQAEVGVRVYSLRGVLVRTLYSGPLGAGDHVLTWDGRSDDGAEVASGVYLFDVRGAGERHTAKSALLK